jgi:hypothetical protein
MTFDNLPGWNFEVREISAGVFKATASDRLGRNIEQTGINPDVLLDECKKYAQDILNEK